MVLAIIAVMLAAGLSARDVLFTARTLNVTTTFVEPWLSSFRQFQRTTGRVPGDDPTAPTGFVKGAVGAALCNVQPGGAVTHELSNEFLSVGVPLPEARHRPQRPDVLVYADDEGLPQSAVLCLSTLPKAEVGGFVGSYVNVPRAAVLIRALHWTVAVAIDRALDDHISSRFGRVRSAALAGELMDPMPGSDCWHGGTCVAGAGADGLVDVAVFVE